MDDIKISPCPFCGSEVEDMGARVNYSKMIVTLRLKCTKCGTTTSLKLNFSYNPYVEAVRHYLKWLRGDTDEPHDRGVVWNLLCCIWTVKHKEDKVE